MFFKQYYLGCLAHGSYLIGSQGVAAVIDPQRDVDAYLEDARANGLAIRYIIETHVHADFVSGHRELAHRTGAQIVLGRRAAAEFPHRAVQDGDEIALGAVTLKILETPGHTPESISILAVDADEPDAPGKLFTGDTLFIGDVGRPDLVGAKGLSAQEMASLLYDSLHEKILTLDDAVGVFPAHGAGSLCGRNISTERSSTIGEQRRTNAALAPMTKAQFVSMATSGLPETPAYFGVNARLNLGEVPSLGDIGRPRRLSPQQVNERLEGGALALDVRPSEEYGRKHVLNSLNIGLDGQFASWAGTMLDYDRPLIVVTDTRAQVDEAVLRLARVGFASVIGYLEGGVEAWERAGLPVASIEQISVHELHDRLAQRSPRQFVDVRRPAEFETGAAPGAISIPLPDLAQKAAQLDRDEPTVVICGSGYRSSIATSLLESKGFRALTNVEGGMTAYNEARLPVAEHA